jgi:hypothetical protein
MMSSDGAGRSSVRDDVAYIVGTSVAVVVLVNLGLTAALLWVFQNGGVRAGPAAAAQFAAVYLSTFALSLTMSLALAAYAVPRMYGFDASAAGPFGVTIVGGFLSGLAYDRPWNPFRHPVGPAKVWLILMALAALSVFANIYGVDFLGGLVSGLGGGLVLIAILAHRLSQPGREPDPTRPAEPWRGGTAGIMAALLALAVLVSLVFPALRAPAGAGGW